MSATASTMLALGTKAPGFSLKDLDGNTVSPESFSDKKALLVIFMCNHCPYVKHVIGGIVKLADDYTARGVGIVGINSNDADEYPDDSPELMVDFAKAEGISFPYLYDESQEVARSYKAACTPDFFLFDENRELVYRGQMDAARPGNDVPVTGGDLREALDAVLGDTEINPVQKPSMGCNIKWKSGNEPVYFK